MSNIPITYVPARNTVFLSIALAWAESLKAYNIFIGVNSVDYSGYPDCRPKFIKSFEETANLATKVGMEGKNIVIHTPLIDLTKKEIIELGLSLGVNYGLTSTCYDPNKTGNPCGSCDACILRLKGFQSASEKDPLSYSS
jgi:7-cyano-7-deazaguanine synthase